MTDTHGLPPERSGEAQRQELRGFTRLRAILWSRSVQLTEMVELGGRRWYWRLKFQLWRSFRGLELHSRDRVAAGADIYGSTPLITLCKLLDLCGRQVPQHRRTFLDLGSGAGQLVLGAGCQGYTALGLEKEAAWVQRSRQAASRLGLDGCRFEAGDLFAHPWPESGVVFTVATAFEASQRAQLVERFKTLSPHTLLVLGDMSPGADFDALWQGRLPVDWGIIPFGIYRFKDEFAEPPPEPTR